MKTLFTQDFTALQGQLRLTEVSSEVYIVDIISFVGLENSSFTFEKYDFAMLAIHKLGKFLSEREDALQTQLDVLNAMAKAIGISPDKLSVERAPTVKA